MRIITSELLEMTYNELCNYYIKKYGNVKYDYFSTPECKSVQKKNSRTKEGLEIHHIDEDKYPCLSDSSYAQNCPFESQKSDRLVYVNILEHLFLHIKIYEKGLIKNSETGKITVLGHPGIHYISHKINSCYAEQPLTGWRVKMSEIINENYEDYISELIYYLRNLFVFFPQQYGMIRSEMLSLSKDYNNEIDLRVYNILFSEFLGNLTFKVGDIVFHNEFGEGKILKIDFYKGRLVAGIEFKKVGKKIIDLTCGALKNSAC